MSTVHTRIWYIGNKLYINRLIIQRHMANSEVLALTLLQWEQLLRIRHWSDYSRQNNKSRHLHVYFVIIDLPLKYCLSDKYSRENQKSCWIKLHIRSLYALSLPVRHILQRVLVCNEWSQYFIGLFVLLMWRIGQFWANVFHWLDWFDYVIACRLRSQNGSTATQQFHSPSLYHSFHTPLLRADGACLHVGPAEDLAAETALMHRHGYWSRVAKTRTALTHGSKQWTRTILLYCWAAALILGHGLSW